jgi:adenosylcobyric acid synthase
MVLGTASHAGKSLVTAGLGRIFSDSGLKVAPFKAQNMSLNSAATPDGREIGRAQALQAEACRVMAKAEMNPVLLKPTSDTESQVILVGRVWGQVTAADYFERRVEDLFPAVLESYRSLASQYELILLEGAGSPAEINLREHDIVNMRMAHAADAACILVGDIDRGGVFASLLGTMELLTLEDRARIRGFLVNKFRGELSLLRPGVETIEQRLGIPCAGVIPYLRGHGLEEEDSVALEDRRTPDRLWREPRGPRGPEGPLRIGIVALPHMANFTDFDALAMEPCVSLAFLEDPRDAEPCDVLVLPGSKQTFDDLAWLRGQGFADRIVRHPGLAIGICGGFQMMGIAIDDPLGVENGGLARSVAGLGLLPVRTVMRPQKTVRRASGELECCVAPRFTGYEIHMGETEYGAECQPFARILREGDAAPVPDGATARSGRVWGTYVHGIFDNDAFRHAFLDAARKACGLEPAAEYQPVTGQRDARIDRWADHLRRALDLNLIRRWIGVRA